MRLRTRAGLRVPVAALLLAAARATAGPLEDGAALEAQGKLPEAKAAYEAAVAADPADRNARLKLAHAEIGTGDLAAAEKLVNAELARTPGDPRWLNERGRLAFNRGRFPEAVAAFAKASEGDPSFLDALYNLGIAEESSGKLDAARAAFTRALALSPASVKCLNGLGVVEAKAKRYPEALDALGRAEAASASDYETLYNLGIVWGEQDKLDQSVGYFRKAVAARPDSAEALNNLGRTLVRLKLYDEARTRLEAARALAPKMAEPVFNLGILEEELKRPAEAEADYRTTVGLAPAFAEAWFRLGNLALARAQTSGTGLEASARARTEMASAADLYGNAVKANAEYPEALYNLVLTLLELRRLDEAARAAYALVKIQPGNAQNQMLLATVESQRASVAATPPAARERMAASERHYRAALKIDPACQDCRFRLASLLFQEGNLDGAVKAFKAVLAADDKNVDAHYLLGTVLFRQRELSAARKEMDATLALKPDHLDALNSAATIAAQQRKLKDATIYIGRALDADPGYLPTYRTAEMVYSQMADITVSGSPHTVAILTKYILAFRMFYKDAKGAARLLRQLLDLEPRCTAARLKLGVLDVLAGRNAVGLEELDAAARLAPGDPEIEFGRGSAEYNLGEQDKRGEKSPHYAAACDAYRRAAASNPAYTEAWWGLGSALFKMGRYREAAAALERCLQLNPYFAEAYNTYGSVLVRETDAETDPVKRTARLDQAAQLYQQALRANPNSDSAHYNLGVVYHQEQKWKEAIAEYQAALRINPSFTVAWYRLARLYVDRKGWFDRGRAEEAFKKVVELEPGNCEYLFDFGAFYFNTRQYEKAKAQWSQVLQRCPDHKPARDGMERLIERGY